MPRLLLVPEKDFNENKIYLQELSDTLFPQDIGDLSVVLLVCTIQAEKYLLSLKEKQNDIWIGEEEELYNTFSFVLDKFDSIHGIDSRTQFGGIDLLTNNKSETSMSDSELKEGMSVLKTAFVVWSSAIILGLIYLLSK